MDLAKLVIAFSIAILLSGFLSEIVGTIYPAPSLGGTSNIYTNTCSDLVTEKCGDSQSYTNYTEYSKCSSGVRLSQEYKTCTTDQTNSYQTRQENYESSLQTYQLVNLIIFGVLSIILIVLGFLMIHLRSIGSGLIMAGIFIFLAGSTVSLITSMMGSLFSSLSTQADTGFATITKLIRLGGELIILILLFILSYKKVENEGESD